MVLGTCNVCRKEKIVHREPTLNQLVFGGFPIRTEYRCDDCEEDVVNKVDKIWDNMGSGLGNRE